MVGMISVQNLTFLHNTNLIFNKGSFSVAPNQKIGLVGPNGAGKTTLLNLLAKKEIANEGKIDVTGSIALVPQEVKFDPDLEKSRSIREYLDPENKKLDYELDQMLGGLELERIELVAKPLNLSGGQKTKLALARALLMEPDILLLDEPTNFLDVAGKRWVMDFLSKYPKTVILISHDLELLDKHIDKVIFINTQFKRIEEYSGNYSKFLKLKQEKEDLEKRHILNEQKNIKRMEKSLIKLYRLTSAKGVRQRKNLQNRIERMKENLPEMPKELQKIKITLPEISWLGEVPIKAVSLSKSYGEEKVLNDVSFYITRGERFALVGPNGAGKSTLIKILVGLLEQDNGEVIKDQNLKLGYYSQEFDILDLDKTLFEVVKEASNKPDNFIRPFLAKFLFPGDKIFQRISSLSGGEKTRLSIALLMLHDYNLLVLDEPTTYLDVLSQRIILEALKQYKGSMIVVSHTSEFIKELNPNRVMFLPENKIEIWRDEYLDRVETV